MIKSQLNDSFKKQVEAQSQYSKNKRLEKEKEEQTIISLMEATGLGRNETKKVMAQTRKDIEEKEAKRKNRIGSIIVFSCAGFLVLSMVITLNL